MIRLESKTPAEVRDYTLDWSAFLGSDVIVSSVVVPTGITVNSQEDSSTQTRVVVSGGTDGVVATLVNTITTAGGSTETETFTIKIGADEPLNLAEVKDHLRVLHDDEDVKIAAMIPRARLWVEDHTGLALVQRQFTENKSPKYGVIHVSKGPLVALESINHYVDGTATPYEGRTLLPTQAVFPALNESWPAVTDGDGFTVVYTAGFAPGEADDRLIGAMLALIEGEYSEGFAYPDRSVEAAKNCCSYLRPVFG